MPKSSFQVFTDTNTKVITGLATEGNSNNGGKKVTVERIENIMGSSAGAGSGEFHNYLEARKRENHRMASLEDSKREEDERKAFAEKVMRNKAEAEQRTQKNALKRKLKNNKKDQRKLQKKMEKLEKEQEKTEESDSDDSDGEANGEDNNRNKTIINDSITTDKSNSRDRDTEKLEDDAEDQTSKEDGER